MPGVQVCSHVFAPSFQPSKRHCVAAPPQLPTYLPYSATPSSKLSLYLSIQASIRSLSANGIFARPYFPAETRHLCSIRSFAPVKPSFDSRSSPMVSSMSTGPCGRPLQPLAAKLAT